MHLVNINIHVQDDNVSGSDDESFNKQTDSITMDFCRTVEHGGVEKNDQNIFTIN